MATVQYDHNSNIFYLADNAPSQIGKDGPSRSDNVLTYAAGADAKWLMGRHQVDISAKYSRAEYDQFTQLNHNEYLGDATWSWSALKSFDGSFGYKYDRHMVSFTELNTTANVNTTELLVETGKTALATANVNITPRWRLESGYTSREVESPRPGLPGLKLEETLYRAGIRYLGISKLLFGIDGNYTDGEFGGDPNTVTKTYDSTSYLLTAEYAVTQLSKFNGSLGYSTRHEAAGGKIWGVVGSLSYGRWLTAKTNVNLQVARSVNSYITNESSVVDTTGVLTVLWEATRKIGVQLSGGLTNSDFPLSGTPTSSPRNDHAKFAAMQLRYQILEKVSIRPYYRYEKRNSNHDQFTYDVSTYGIELHGEL